MNIIQINDVAVQVIRSARRKSIAIKIQDGNVSLHIPKLMPLWLAKQFVMRKQSWIDAKLQQYQQRPEQRQFMDGEQHAFLGTHYPLEIVHQPNRQRLHLQFDDQKIVILAPDNVTPVQIQQTLVRWYKRQAESLLKVRVAELAKQTGLQPKLVQIKSYKSRWGSCNARGDIQLNWQLIQASDSIRDYVIIHELCHLQHLNHSKAFWDLVERFDPNHRQHRNWLKHHGHQLVI